MALHAETTYVIQTPEGRPDTIELDGFVQPEQSAESNIRLTVIGMFDRDAHDERMTLWLRAAELRELVAAANELLGRADAADLLLLHGEPRTDETGS